MRRGRGKGRRLTDSNNREEGEEEKIPVQRKRGRPQKLLKDTFSEIESGKIEEDEGGEDAKSIITTNTKEPKESVALENGKKRKQIMHKSSSFNEETSVFDILSSPEDSSKSNVGFRHSGSRRKSKPRRAAEVGVEC